MEESIVNMISQVGFPIVVAMYSLIRLEAAIRENTRITTKMYERLGGDEEKDD